MFRSLVSKVLGATLLIGVGLVLHAQAHFIKSDVAVEPATLKHASVQTVTFKPPITGLYDVGLRMDQKTAMARFPCAVDLEKKFGKLCPETDLRFNGIVSLYEGDRLLLSERTDIEVRGGSYGGEDSFTFNLIDRNLSKGKTYRLSVLYEDWTPGLEGLKPDLVVELNTLDGKSRLLGYTLEWLLGLCLIILGGVGVFVAVGLHLISRAKAKTASQRTI